ncbi:MAG: phenylalanine--tRNA ligase subunit beta [Acidobacteria bacterium]|nr:phenylalanine--tRNA ligase subunit beta [Acidobacteriota bacterium]
MFFSYDWIKKYLPGAPELAEVARLLNETGLETEVLKGGVEVEHTVNRPDAMCHFGIARELSVKTGLPLHEPEIYEEPFKHLDGWRIDSTDAVGCPQYMGLLIEHVAATPSPSWLVRHLEAIEQTSHNLLVDLSNFLLWEFGHPCHAFDADRVGGQQIIVRKGESGERLTTLDGRDHDAEGLLCIADDTRPIAFAGVMGGENSEVHSGTTRLLLELARFDPSSVRATGRRCNIHSDARHRFERGVDPERMEQIVRRFVQLLLAEQPQARVVGWMNMDLKPFKRTELLLRSKRLARILGIELSHKEVTDLLVSMGFAPQERDGGWWVSCPGYKVDVVREIDVIEEVIRFAGLDRLDTSLPAMAGSDYDAQSIAAFEDHLLKIIKEMGLQEARTYSFLNPATEKLFGGDADPVFLRNPMSESQAVMRRNILPNLIEVLSRNVRHGNKNLRLFEMGHVYHGQIEPHFLAITITAGNETEGWWEPSNHHPFLVLKGYVMQLFDEMGWPEIEVVSRPCSYLEEEISLGLNMGGASIGFMGMLSNRILGHFDLDQPVAVCEMDLSMVRAQPKKKRPFKALALFPGIQIDLAFVVDLATSYADLAGAIATANLPNLEDVQLFDQYVGKALGSGKKSLGFRFRFRSSERTLTNDEVMQSIDRLVSQLADQFGASLRS